MSTRWLFVPAALATTLGCFLFWRWMGEPVVLPDVPGGRIDCVSYTPFEPGELPEAGPGWVSSERVADDLRRLAPITRCLRVYTPLGNTPRIVAAADAAGFRVLLGAWIGSDLDQNEREVSAALELARRYPRTIEAIVVGNEVLLRRDLPAAKLAALIREVREESPVPVAYAEIAHYLEEAPEVAAAADLLLIHLLPYWDDPVPPPVGDAVEQVVKIEAEFRAKFPGKPVRIGETGWPSKGRMRGPGHAGLIEEARFVRGFAARAAAIGLRYNLIEAIDQPWKRVSEGTVGGYWGILDEHRRPKFPLTGPVSARPEWRAGFAVSAVAALALLALGLVHRRDARAWMGLVPLAMAFGILVPFQWDYVSTTSRNAWGWIAGAGALVATILAAAMIDGILRGIPRVPPAPLAALPRAFATPMRLMRDRALRDALYVAIVTPGAAWLGLTFAFDPRFRDVPVAWFALPALAIALRFGRLRENAGSRREEAVLAATLVVTGGMQLSPLSPESLAWLAISGLIALPWVRDIRALVHT